MMNTQQEYEQLKRKNRRRLLGATVIVAIAAAILLSVLNHSNEPPPLAQIEIAGTAPQNSAKTEGEVQPKPPVASESEPVASAADTATVAVPPATSAPAVTEKAAPPEAETIPKLEIAPKAEAKKQVAVVRPEKTTPPPTQEKTETKSVKPPKSTTEKLSPQEILDGKAGKQTSMTQKKPTATASSSGQLIQAGAFMNIQQAETQRSRLAQIGVASTVSRATTTKGEVYRVRIGPFASHEETQRTLSKLHANGFDGIVVGK